MIKFFRHIRRSLINQNQMGKYFKYAIGEILLVVIGILIALQINNANELRKQKQVEINILEGIKNDILLDTVDLNENFKHYNFFHKKDSMILKHLLDKRKKEDSIVAYLEISVVFDLILNLHDSHFEEAKIKGLSIISNNSLRDRISRLYEFDYKSLKLLENSTDSYDTHKLLVPIFQPYFGLNQNGVTMSDEAYKELTSNGSALHYFREAMYSKEFLLNKYERTLTNVLQVVDSIETELTRLKN